MQASAVQRVRPAGRSRRHLKKGTVVSRWHSRHLGVNRMLSARLADFDLTVMCLQPHLRRHNGFPVYARVQKTDRHKVLQPTWYVPNSTLPLELAS